MSSGRVPVLRPREVVRTFERLGWEVARQKGSPGITVEEFLEAVES